MPADELLRYRVEQLENRVERGEKRLRERYLDHDQMKTEYIPREEHRRNQAARREFPIILASAICGVSALIQLVSTLAHG